MPELRATERENMQPAQQVTFSKVKELNPSTKQVNLLAKVVSVGDRRTIDSKFGGSRTLCEAVVGDETGTVILSLWEAQIGTVGTGSVLQVNNGYVSLVRGRIRLNVGKYGSLETVARELPEVNKGNDLSAQEHASPPREDRGGFGGRPGGGGSFGGRGRGGRPKEKRLHGRRRF
ncbi:MAG TPA: single-stranded DNA-binding protein [Thermoplasmata archaeon]|nr:single-stranded DNA-binding protein [Thermoplasmata archaeon]